ncbi:MAG: protein translocase subunit SecD [Cephaloticoccus sp.]|nr:protein translocase subunit SecD [Cephaloticoccus sp.]MCF7759846.1 protein translocase subunit SecD [Cephaloticoccus sp.]
MLRRNLWKLLLSLAIVGWAVASLLPFKDQPFPDYLKSHATANQAEFARLVDEAVALTKVGSAPSEFVALKRLGKERKIDLAQYFPNERFEAKLHNVERRNDILLNELLKRSKSALKFGLDLYGGMAFTLEVDEKAAKTESLQDRKEKLDKAIEIIGQRINAFGVTEPVIRPVGNNRIEVQLPGINTKDNPEVVDNVKKPARLDFRFVHPTISPRTSDTVPPGYEMMTLDYEGQRGEASTEELYVKRIPEMTGEAIDNAFARPDIYGKPEVILQFTSEGKKRFAAVTRDIAEAGQKAGTVGRLAIVLDGKLYSAPTVKQEIDSDSAQISGSFSEREALNLANVLNNPLDLPLIIKEQYEVSPSLAKDAISSGVKASVIGTVLVAAFMITYYTVGGIVAVLTLGINLLIIVGVMASIGATMTLPGIAGIVLTVGMAVDANILIFERMREELNLGKSLRAAVSAGYDKAFTTIIDAHLTQLAICAVMIGLGSGPIKGFGVTLAIGVFSTMFSVLITGHFFTEWLVDKGIIKKIPMMSFIKSINMDFLKYGRPAFIVSWLIVLIGVGVVFAKGDRIYGIDFAGGDSITVDFKERISSAQIREVAIANKLGEVNPVFVSELGTGHETLRIETAYDKSDETLAALVKAYPNAGLEKIGESSIGPSIGAEIQWNALKALFWSMVIVLAYVALRFEFGFGIGAVVASVHDILMTIGIFVLVGHQFSAPMVAAILCVAGYSINDTIVVFDRIREELKLDPNTRLRDVVNMAIHRVFARSLMTSLTTLLAAASLYIFGTGVLKDLSFTFIVGIITGTFSSIFIASPVFYWWHKGDRKHVEAHADVLPKYEWTGSSKASE